MSVLETRPASSGTATIARFRHTPKTISATPATIAAVKTASSSGPFTVRPNSSAHGPNAPTRTTTRLPATHQMLLAAFTVARKASNARFDERG
jgi:hypothetical protein